MTMATVGSRFQVVIPRRERERVGLEPHSKVRVEVRDDCIVLYQQANSTLRGIGRTLADGVDATDYVQKLRQEWGVEK